MTSCIVIPASHNSKEYNSYKVYSPDGGQITDEAGLFSVLTGNQMGALLLDYVITTRKEQEDLPHPR